MTSIAKSASALLPMHTSLRCGAKTRSGMPCEAPAVVGKRRCRMHGGAAGSGAPKGNQNAVKHGEYTAETLALKKRIINITRQSMAITELPLDPLAISIEEDEI